MAFLLGLGVLGQIAGHLGSHHKGADPATQPNPYGASFGNVLNGQMDALGASDPLAQLTAIVQKGTPISTVIDRLANNVAGGRAAVVHSIKSALSPPSNAPPGETAAQQVAALARRLQSWLSGVAGGADQRVGQQSDTSGQVLDANPARELPAHNDPEPASSQLDASALAQSLLAQVAASFGAVSSAPATPLASSDAHEMVTSFSDRAKAQAEAVSSFARMQAGQVADASQQDASSQGVSSQGQSGNPADLLARMLMRAANVDARVNANAVATAALSARGSGEQTAAAVRAVNASPGHAEGAGFQPATARLAAILGDVIAAASASNNGASDNGANSRNPGNGFASDATVASKPVAARTDALAFAVPAASQSFAHGTLPSATGSAAGASVDPSAIIEQVVRGMSLRTQSDGTSEVRLRLVPEQLGAVTLRLTVDGSNVSATALAQNADVRNALVAHQHQLARSLADAGLKLTGFTVNLSGGDAGNDRNRDRTSGFGRQYAVHEVAAAGASDSTESSAAGPSILPESTLALFNYLA